MPTTFQNVKNWALTASTETVAQSPATITVTDATQLPDAPFRVVVWRSGKGSPYQDLHRKIFAVTDVTGNVLTVTAVSGDATVLPIGSAVGVHVLAEDLQDVHTAITAAEGHNHTGVYEPANANIQTHIGITAGNPHGTTAGDVGAAPALHGHDLTYAPLAEGVTNGDSHDHSGGDGAQIAYANLSGAPDLSSLHTRGHAVASALDHTDWPADLTAAELAHVHGVTSAIQTQLNGKSAAGHDHSGVYEPVLSAGTSAQYYRGDKTWQTLNQAAVAGLTTTDIVRHAGLGIGTVPTAGVQMHMIDGTNNLNVWQLGPTTAGKYCQFMFGEGSSSGQYGGIYRPSNASTSGGTTVFYSRAKPLAFTTVNDITYPGTWFMVMDANGDLEIKKGLKVGTVPGSSLGFYGATPVTQRAGAAQAAAPAGGTGATAGAYDTAAHRDALIALVNEMRTVLVNLGLMKGSA